MISSYLSNSTNTAYQEMRWTCHNILCIQANSAAVAAPSVTSPPTGWCCWWRWTPPSSPLPRSCSWGRRSPRRS